MMWNSCKVFFLYRYFESPIHPKMAHFQPSSFSGQFQSLELTGVQLTGKKLGKGSDATVQEVNWHGTLCAAKQLHEILLEDDSPGGARRFIKNFEKECITWSKLIHPHIIQFLGVCFLSGSRVLTLILEKMDTSLRNYLEVRKKEEFPLPDKVYVLRQVAQALSYLHSRSPPLVHHDLSSNNILLNVISLQTKVTDFGMTRALDPSKMSQKSSIKGTQAFMPPEGLVDPPKYDDKLDVFSYGNVIVTTVTHQWPEPGPSKEFQGDVLIGVSELKRRQQYIDQFSQEERALLLPTVYSCLEDRPSQRPTSIQLVYRMRQIEASHPREVQSGGSTIAQLRDQLEHCRAQLQAAQLKEKTNQSPSETAIIAQLRVELQQKDTQLHQFRMQLQERKTQYRTQLQEKDAQLKQKDEDSGQEYALLLHQYQQIQERDHLTSKQERDKLSTHLKPSSPDSLQPLSTQTFHHKTSSAAKQVSRSFVSF